MDYENILEDTKEDNKVNNTTQLNIDTQGDTYNDKCFICLGTNDPIIKANLCCGTTIYHEECMREYINNNNNNLKCAICREDISDKLYKKLNHTLSYEKIGDIRRARNNLEGAEASYRESLMIRKKLSAKFPKNNDWQRDLSVSYDRVGDVLKIRKKVDDAKQMYLDSLNIRKKLAAKELNNVLWQTDLVASYGKVAIVLKNGSDEDRAEARRMLLEALKLLNRLNEQKLLGPEHKKWIPLTKKLLTEIPEIPQIPLKKDPEINTPKNTPTMEQNVPLENPNQQIAPLQKPIPQDPPPRKKIPQNTPLVPTPDIP